MKPVRVYQWQESVILRASPYSSRVRPFTELRTWFMTPSAVIVGKYGTAYEYPISI